MRGTAPPPHRRTGVRMIVRDTGITSFEIVILFLVILFCAICIASGTEYLKFRQKEKIIRGGGNRRSVVLRVAGIVRVFGGGFQIVPQVSG